MRVLDVWNGRGEKLADASDVRGDIIDRLFGLLGNKSAWQKSKQGKQNGRFHVLIIVAHRGGPRGTGFCYVGAERDAAPG